jgi:hypothetical protein
VQDGRFAAHAPARPVFGPGSLAEAWSFVEWRATEDLLAQEPSPICLHAAGIQLGSAALLLVGESGSGKSTLAAALFERGHDLWGDDLVRFAPEDGLFSVFPRSLKLDNKSMSYLRLIAGVCSNATVGTFFASGCWYVSPAAIRRGWQAPPGRPRSVVLLERREHRGPARVERTSEGAAAVVVSQRLLGRRGSADEQARLTVQVLDALRDVTAYRVSGGDPAAIAVALEKELEA